MPTKKQRRRRDKSRRHEYEYVYVDEEGREVEVDPDELRAAAPAKQPKNPRDRHGRPVRKVEPPSWRRVGRRTVVFAPLMFIVVWLLRPKDTPAAAAVLQGLILLLFFLPFSYLMDSFVYRAYLRRTRQPAKPS